MDKPENDVSSIRATDKEITWYWREHPIGFPLDPEDEDFEGPRTPPYVSLVIRYEKGDILIRQQVMVEGTLETLTDEMKQAMKQQLRDWLKLKLNGAFSDMWFSSRTIGFSVSRTRNSAM